MELSEGEAEAKTLLDQEERRSSHPDGQEVLPRRGRSVHLVLHSGGAGRRWKSHQAAVPGQEIEFETPNRVLVCKRPAAKAGAAQSTDAKRPALGLPLVQAPAIMAPPVVEQAPPIVEHVQADQATQVEQTVHAQMSLAQPPLSFLRGGSFVP